MSNTMAREAADKAKESAGQVGARASAMMHGAQDVAADLTHRAQEGLGAIKEAASDYVEQGREKAAALGRTVEGQVKEWPFSAVLVAAGVGLVLGVVLRGASAAFRTDGRKKESHDAALLKWSALLVGGHPKKGETSCCTGVSCF